jgi:DNA polymerase V
MDEQELENSGVSIHSGFPNAAVGSSARLLDLNRLLIKHPAATYLMRLGSNEWSDRGMFAGDIVIVDRSLEPKKQDTVIWGEGEQFIVGLFKDAPKDTEIWGTVTSIIHQLEK